MKPARIIVLVIAIAAGGVAALLAGRTPAPPQAPAPAAPPMETADILIAAQDLSIGTKLSPTDLRWQTWPAAAVGPSFYRRSEHPDGIDKLAGSTTRAAFSAGEPIRESKLMQGTGGFMAAIVSQGKRAVSVEISAETGAGGFILPNDHVDVILSRKDHDKDASLEKNKGEIILSNVPVLAIDQLVEEKAGQRVLVGRTATLELTPNQAETLAGARQLGTLSLALRSMADTRPEPERLVDKINLWRGGKIDTVVCTPLCQ